MKKILSFCLLVSFTMWGMGAALLPVNAQAVLDAGSVIKMDGESTLYYLGEDNKVYVFPNAGTYFSWFDEFTGIVTVNAEDFALYELGGTVYYQPGSLLVKTPSSLKVYAVGLNGELRWIETEELAIEYYGENWNLLVDDISDGFFTNYTFGEAIDEVDDYDPDVEEEEVPTISHNKGFKAKAVVISKTQKRCEYLENAVNKLQKRAERWGVEIPSLGDDYIEACIGGVAQDAELDESAEGTENGNADRVTVCKTPRGNSGKAHTIRISRNALKANINAGFLLGACEGDKESEEGDDETDAIAPAITDVLFDEASSTVTWTTDEDADSKVVYAIETISSTTVTDFVESTDMVTAHSLELTGLSTSTQYFFYVESSDEAGNKATSSEYIFTTLE